MNNKNHLPKHVVIIPDGNRRWAKEKGLPTIEGHRYAAQTTLPNLISELAKLNIKYFTFWALSTENLIGRSKEELDYLFDLTRFFLKNKLKEFKEKGIKLKIIGDLTNLPKDLQKEILKITADTKENKKMTLVLGLNYGGRDEIIRAIKKIRNSKFEIRNLTKENFGNYLDTTGIPDPDLIIRTGGEKRLSGFMLWQSEYSELYFSDLYFPDFTAKELEKSINNYLQRQRRFGK
ncbi:di-trans,poly-cis-decaprenylcistransferase [Candidatus Roizmanbacteria bacterium CG22_combo_CG10-13_8_21_14_all_35_9]|uniref:Isoprenyl transferase n=4 Tax=Candidatus Roizmaniibacteriota TaxID=1752723 RepID=A0A2M8F460_9BACT|nr:MAG: di-trans,poly-cis-decaprenylcistransferase [Candidatus Roizmanbacteria bacterium CG23_combo_of_CG06-09_8_20_14_all_35_49]PIP62688.1 MAG: di-trans,poly-cis-decaprenylcistransferase [Candidatus Roizmanbacteria bacterium CG22_combo_CG10-13_8_21_14_all_35_9]PIY71091.1 MAG: di-trans,poly-cis-decaprenylcistransferase [Candidatus Roizmanbacteria bacterium CG_4_10_14_0_8_um_filter_35_28]PJC34093.1 MAG: di-trans,poly-cis-decaprenylcistransferase [Candidatus Roizmanbacteria bacterium CG_4_9_14_0_2